MLDLELRTCSRRAVRRQLPSERQCVRYNCRKRTDAQPNRGYLYYTIDDRTLAELVND